MSDSLRPYGSSGHGISQARILEWVAMFQGIFPTQGLNLCLLRLLHWQVGSLPSVPPGKPLYSAIKKERRLVLGSRMGGLGGYYAK